MNKSIYYGWFFVILLVFLSTCFQLVRQGPSLRVLLGFLIGTGALFFLRIYKKNID